MRENNIVPLRPVAGTEISENLSASRSLATRRAYASVMRGFVKLYLFPASPFEVAEYLSGVGTRLSPVSVRVHAAAIHAAHLDAGLESPVVDAGVKRVLAGLSRRKARMQRQAAPIDGRVYEAITETARLPRVGRGGRLESVSGASDRGLLDMSMIGLMRDAMLRRSECSALIWGDLSFEPDGSGRLLVRRSKTDQEGEGSVRYVSEGVTCALGALRSMRFGKPLDAMFGLSDSQICRRIKAACAAAGFEGEYSGHSPRIGMAQDLARAGCGLVELQVAGGWKSPEMPARYARHMAAGRGAVAKWYGKRGVGNETV